MTTETPAIIPDTTDMVAATISGADTAGSGTPVILECPGGASRRSVA
jgi:hypothetical protein